MDQLATLEFALNELREQVAAVDESEMDVVSNCDPWTVRRLASHALNNQLLWGGVVTGEQTVSVDDTVNALAYEGDLARFADEVVARSLAMWRTEGVLTATHSTPLGELPGSVVINFPTIDAFCHAWDVSASVGRAIAFPPDMIPTISSVVAATCNDTAREIGLIKAVADTPPDATETERLMALAGRSINR